MYQIPDSARRPRQVTPGACRRVPRGHPVSLPTWAGLSLSSKRLLTDRRFLTKTIGKQMLPLTGGRLPHSLLKPSKT